MKNVVLLLVAAPLALAACGGSSSSQVKVDPLAFVKHSAQKTAALPSEHMTMKATIGMGPVSVKLTGSGDFATATKKGQMNLALSVAGQRLPVDEITDGTTIYIKSPIFGSQFSGGKTWTKIDLQKLAGSQATHTKLLSSLMSRSPSQALRQLLAAGSVKNVGSETIDGAETTHYQITNLDLSKMPHGAQFQALAHPKYGPINVWIGNKDGYVYRESLSFTYSVAGQSAAMSMRIDLSKFGEKVNVAIPPASKTVDFSNLVNGATGLGA